MTITDISRSPAATCASASTITVFSKPSCVQCDATKRALMKAGLPYDEVDVTIDGDALEYVKALGISQAPVVITADDRWSGFRPDKIKALAAAA